MPAQQACGRSDHLAVVEASPVGIQPSPHRLPRSTRAGIHPRSDGATQFVVEARAAARAVVSAALDAAVHHAVRGLAESRWRPANPPSPAAPIPAPWARCRCPATGLRSACVRRARWSRRSAPSPGTGPPCPGPGPFPRALCHRGTADRQSGRRNHHRAAMDPTRSGSPAASTRHVGTRIPAVMEFLSSSTRPACSGVESVGSAAVPQVGRRCLPDQAPALRRSPSLPLMSPSPKGFRLKPLRPWVSPVRPIRASSQTCFRCSTSD